MTYYLVILNISFELASFSYISTRGFCAAIPMFVATEMPASNEKFLSKAYYVAE
jgi:hypothetical protein